MLNGLERMNFSASARDGQVSRRFAVAWAGCLPGADGGTTPISSRTGSRRTKEVKREEWFKAARALVK